MEERLDTIVGDESTARPRLELAYVCMRAMSDNVGEQATLNASTIWGKHSTILYRDKEPTLS